MINTIFYYPDSMTFEEYQSKVGTDIAARTIVFADAQKAIYKGGKQFGATSLTDLKNQIQLIFNENPYTLPIATASRLGGIMIGEGFHIDANTGRLDVDFSGITNGTNGRNGMDGLIKTIFDSVTNIRASKNDYGIVKVGDGINVVDGVISVDFSNVDLSEINNNITSLKASVALHTNAITDLTGRLSSAEATLTTKANASNVYTKTQIDGKITTINETISQLSGGAELDLSAITNLENGLAEVRASLTAKADASETYTKTYIDGLFSSIETTLSTLGASSGVDTSAITDLVNRMSAAESALTSKANASETYKKTEVDGKISTVETQMTNLGSSSGLSNIAITDLKNRMSSAESSLTSKANASETYTKTEIDNKITTINTTLEALGAESGVDTSAITDLVNRVAAAETTLQSKANSDTVYTKTEIDGKITTINSSISANSGLKTAADVKSAFSDDGETIYTSGTASATLFAKIKSDADAKYAGIDVAVRKVNVGTSANPNYQLESGVTISADNVDFTANNFSIDASKIDLRGEVILEQLSGTYVTGSSGPIKTSTGSIPGHTYLGSVSFDPTELRFVREINQNTTFTTDIQPGYVTTKEVHGDGLYTLGAIYIKTNGGYIYLSDNDGNLQLQDVDLNYGTLELGLILLYDGNDSTSLIYNGSSDELSCGANLSVSGNGYCGGNLKVNGTVTADNFIVQTGISTTASGWSGTIVVDGNTLTFTGGILTAASGNGVTAAS